MTLYPVGPRNKAVAVSTNPFAAAAPWAASTAYGPGVTLTNGGNTYVTTTSFTSGTTFSTANLTLIAQAGAQGAAAPALSFPFTTDSTNVSYTITHNLNTRNIKSQVQDPSDNYAEVPGLDITYPTVNTAVVTFGAAPGANNLTLVIV